MREAFLAFVGERSLKAFEVVACYSNTSLEQTTTSHRVCEVSLKVLFFNLGHFAHERQGADLLVRLWFTDDTWATGRAPWANPTDIDWRTMPPPAPPTMPEPWRQPIKFSEADLAELEALFAQNEG